MSEATQGPEYHENGVLFVAMELSASKWKLGMSVGKGRKIRERTLEAGDFAGMGEAIERAKKRFGLPEGARVVSCYEAGRDGFWVHRHLEEDGAENIVIDPASVDVNRRRRRRKTDRLDVRKLLQNLIRWFEGEKDVWSVVQIPGEEDEDARHFHRELEALKGEATRHSNRIRGLLALHGIRPEVIGADFLSWLDDQKTGNGTSVPPQLRARLGREHERLQKVREQIAELERQRIEALRTSSDPRIEMVRRLLMLKGIGVNSAWLFTMEFFSWREFRNRREVGSLAGLTPTPWASGNDDREQGIDKAGNARVRKMATEIAWGWLRHQPKSELSLWFQRRYGSASKRMRRVGIVAMTRRLLIAIWRFLDQGIVPKGATLKKA
jgi:transposase